MSRCLQGWRCLPRSRPKLLMTRSNWEVEDGAEPSLVDNSSSTFSLFWTIEHRVGPRAAAPWLAEPDQDMPCNAVTSRVAPRPAQPRFAVPRLLYRSCPSGLNLAKK